MLFSGIITCLTKLLDSLIYKQRRFLGFSGKLGLEATTGPRLAKVLSLNPPKGMGSKIFEVFVDLFLKVDPNGFSELSQSTKKTLFWSNFVRRRRNFEKQAKKGVFRHF